MLWSEGDIRLRERQIASSDAPAGRKMVERNRLATLLSLCDSARCRRQTLLAAFGEASAPCGFCDLCDGAHPKFDGVVSAQKAMSAILRTSGRFFPGHLANLLIGKTTDAIRRHGHQDLRTFGVGSELGAAGWRSIFRQIEGAGLIARDATDGGRWIVTDAGREVLAGNEPLELVAVDTTKRAAEARRALTWIAADEATPPQPQPDTAPDQPEMTVADQRLFFALKAARTTLARERKAPAYVIFSDRTLREIAERRPRNTAALACVKGVGPAKVEAYGAIVLQIVKQSAD
jgi:ATP-dependent DNA helicase RecQ